LTELLVPGAFYIIPVLRSRCNLIFLINQVLRQSGMPGSVACYFHLIYLKPVYCIRISSDIPIENFCWKKIPVNSPVLSFIRTHYDHAKSDQAGRDKAPHAHAFFQNKC